MAKLIIHYCYTKYVLKNNKCIKSLTKELIIQPDVILYNIEY